MIFQNNQKGIDFLDINDLLSSLSNLSSSDSNDQPDINPQDSSSIILSKFIMESRIYQNKQDKKINQIIKVFNFTFKSEKQGQRKKQIDQKLKYFGVNNKNKNNKQKIILIFKHLSKFDSQNQKNNQKFIRQFWEQSLCFKNNTYVHLDDITDCIINKQNQIIKSILIKQKRLEQQQMIQTILIEQINTLIKTLKIFTIPFDIKLQIKYAFFQLYFNIIVFFQLSQYEQNIELQKSYIQKLQNLFLVQSNLKNKVLVDILNQQFKNSQIVILKDYALAIVHRIQLSLKQIQRNSQQLQKNKNFTLLQNDLDRLLKNIQQSKYLFNVFKFNVQVNDKIYHTIHENTFKYQCEICANIFTQSLISFSKCEHKFCNDCLLNRVNQSLKDYEMITCPQDGCSQQIDLDSSFYKSLSHEIRSKYFKIRQIQLTREYNYFQICPKQTCNGIMTKLQNQPMICEICKVQYCKQCFIPKHQGTCNQFQIKQMKSNYKYQQCSNCKNLVEKRSEKQCQHIKCICKYQFCYFCGQKWNTSHYNCQQKTKKKIQQERKRKIQQERKRKIQQQQRKRKIQKQKQHIKQLKQLKQLLQKVQQFQQKKQQKKQRIKQNQNNKNKQIKQQQNIKQNNNKEVKFYQYLYFILLCPVALIILISILVIAFFYLLIRGIFYETYQYLSDFYLNNIGGAICIHIFLVIFFPILFIIGICRARMKTMEFIQKGFAWQWLKNSFYNQWIKIT